MPKLTVDITKRKNRYCAHCENCRKCDYFCYTKSKFVSCWGCCKNFRWRRDIMENYRKEHNANG